jgi:diguanylate cyclase (GGDEF)-like protein
LNGLHEFFVRKFDASTSIPMTTVPAPWLRKAQPVCETVPLIVPPAESHVLARLLHEGFPGLNFPVEIERRYNSETAPERSRTLLISSTIVGLMFNWLLLSDWMMIPDVFEQSLAWRLFIFTPMTLLGSIAITRIPDLQWRERLIFCAAIFGAAINTALSIRSESPYAGPYLSNLTVIAVCFNTVARLPFKTALLLDSSILAMFFYGWAQLTDVSVTIMAPAAMIMVSAMIFTLYGAYCQEHDVRENWLRLLRERVLQNELRQANAKLEAASFIDPLTELSSRRHFDESLIEMWEHAKTAGCELAIIFIDVDHFKDHNRRLGHLRGDACLKAIAGILKHRLRRPEDLVGRFGGQEFMVAMMETSLVGAVGAAERLRKGVEALGDVTVSVGVSCMRPNAPYANIAQLLAAADEALKFAKKQGRNQVVAFGTQD